MIVGKDSFHEGLRLPKSIVGKGENAGDQHFLPFP